MTEPPKFTISKEAAIKKLEPYIIHMIDYIRQGKTGSVQVNFCKGGVGNCNLLESVKAECEERR